MLERLTSEPSRRSGMADMYYYGYLGLGLGPDGRTLYYLTGGPIPGAGKPQLKTVIGVRGDENVHLVTYGIPTGRYQDHGPIFRGQSDGVRPLFAVFYLVRQRDDASCPVCLESY
mgnify:CR=1 FL=1